MPITEARAAAHQKLDEAIQALLEAYDCFTEGQVHTGHVLVVMGTRFMDPDLDPEFFDADDGDEEESVSSYRAFVKRGQLPNTTRGIMETYMDKYRSR